MGPGVGAKVEWLSREIRATGLTQEEFCSRIGISVATLHRAIDEPQNATPRTINALAQGFDIPYEECRKRLLAADIHATIAPVQAHGVATHSYAAPKLPTRSRAEGYAEVPVVGMAQAGYSSAWSDLAETKATVPVLRSGLRHGCEYIAVQVSGESMLFDGILPDDVAIIRRVTDMGDVPAGAVCLVAHRSDGPMLKRVKHDFTHGLVILYSSNHEPIVYRSGDSLRLIGVVEQIARFNV